MSILNITTEGLTTLASYNELQQNYNTLRSNNDTLSNENTALGREIDTKTSTINDLTREINTLTATLNTINSSKYQEYTWNISSLLPNNGVGKPSTRGCPVAP